jgi:NhaA family Na+:H+ antiporter
MEEKIKTIVYKLHPKHVSALFASFLKDESISGKLILVASVLAMLVVNSSLNGTYDSFWHLDFGFGLGNWGLTQDLRHWVNEGLMSFFFLTVGLEIKRELVRGELRDLKLVRLPIAAAIGGMLVPALIYASLNMNPEVIRGWGIPIATDIAFAVGILMLLGKRVPLALKLFLLTLAIADDIGAIFVIALFYAEIIHYGYLFASIIILIATWIFRKKLTGRVELFIVIGAILWVTTHLSGIHASIVGAATGLLAPLPQADSGRSVAERLEKLFLPISTFVVLPVFAFANAGVVLSSSIFTNHASISVIWGVILGLAVGKVVGIVIATWLMVKIGAARLPNNTTWSHIIGVGFIAGIGFTVSIFMTELAFGANEQLLETAKISIFIASIISALLGSAILLKAKRTLAD